MGWTDKWHQRFLRLAKEVSSWSKDPSTQVGAVIVAPDKRIVSVGYNGFPRGMFDLPELYENRDEKYSRMIHAEVNAVLQANSSVAGSTIYVWPFPPCDRCVTMLLQAGIRNFVSIRPSPEAEERWGLAIERTRKYIREMGGTLLEFE